MIQPELPFEADQSLTDQIVSLERPEILDGLARAIGFLNVADDDRQLWMINGGKARNAYEDTLWSSGLIDSATQDKKVADEQGRVAYQEFLEEYKGDDKAEIRAQKFAELRERAKQIRQDRIDRHTQGE